MKKIVQIAVLLPLAALATGCGTPYLTDRGRDAGDIFTVTAGTGLGAKARVGPLHAGLFIGLDSFGLRGGVLEEWPTHGCDAFGVLSAEGTVAAYESFGYAEQRGKDYSAIGYPLVSVVDRRNQSSRPLVHPYYTQIEVAGGALLMFRFGFNPGELLDFILGWFTIDIYNDDLEKGKSDQKLKATGKPVP